MVNVVSKKCEHENCNKQPNFNNPNETVGRFCNGHKELIWLMFVSKGANTKIVIKYQFIITEDNKRKILCRTQATRNGWC
jgi:hypothetical protein